MAELGGPPRKPPPPFVTRTFEESEPWIQATGNRDIFKYYRPEFPTFADAFRSIFPMPLHNQLMNIYTHLLAALLAAILELFSFREESNSIGRRYELHIYRAMAFVCFISSTIYHSCNTIRRWKLRLNRLDYTGILAFLAGGGCALISYSFEKAPALRNFYLAGGFLVSTYLFWKILSSDRFHLESNVGRRTFTFLAFGVSILFPIGHAYMSYGLTLSELFDGLLSFFLCLAAGILCYAYRIPESLYFCRGLFDLCPSHSFFHIFVALAAYCFYVKLLALFGGK